MDDGGGRGGPVDGLKSFPRVIRILRRYGYVVIAPDELDAVNDELSGQTCGCNTSTVEAAQAAAADPREVPRLTPEERSARRARWAELMRDLTVTPAADLGAPWKGER